MNSSAGVKNPEVYQLSRWLKQLTTGAQKFEKRTLKKKCVRQIKNKQSNRQQLKLQLCRRTALGPSNHAVVCCSFGVTGEPPTDIISESLIYPIPFAILLLYCCRLVIETFTLKFCLVFHCSRHRRLVYP